MEYFNMKIPVVPLVLWQLLFTCAGSSTASGQPATPGLKDLDSAITRFDAGSVVRLVSRTTPNSRGPKGVPQLMVGAVRGPLKQVNDLINLGAGVNVLSDHQDSPLSYAVYCDQDKPEVVDTLLRHGASIEAQNNVQDTALITACYGSYTESLRRLIKHGANINARNELGETGLICAAQRGDVSEMELLLNAGADTSVTNHAGLTAWDYALDSAISLRAARTFLAEGAKAENSPAGERSNLMKVVIRGNVEVARLLIDSGADVNRFGDMGRSPLSCAIASGVANMVELLIQKGARTDGPNASGDTPLFYACKYDQPQFCKLLIKKGADVNHKNRRSETALMSACAARSVPVTTILLTAGAHVNEADSDGRAALIYAARSGSLPCVNVLLKSGADVNHRDLQGRTASIYSAGSGDTHTLERLLAVGGDISCRGDNGIEAIRQALYIPLIEYRSIKPNLGGIGDVVALLMKQSPSVLANHDQFGSLIRGSIRSQCVQNVDLLEYLRGAYGRLLASGEYKRP